MKKMFPRRKSGWGLGTIEKMFHALSIKLFTFLIAYTKKKHLTHLYRHRY